MQFYEYYVHCCFRTETKVKTKTRDRIDSGGEIPQWIDLDQIDQ